MKVLSQASSQMMAPGMELRCHRPATDRQGESNCGSFRSPFPKSRVNQSLKCRCFTTNFFIARLIATTKNAIGIVKDPDFPAPQHPIKIPDGLLLAGAANVSRWAPNSAIASRLLKDNIHLHLGFFCTENQWGPGNVS